MKKTIELFSLILLITLLLGLLPCFAQNTTSVFTDVPEHEWFAESVEYVKIKGLMNGITVTTFEPQTSITRGMIVTIIYRLEGSPEVKGELQFSDVNPTYYYCTPIIWASENGIVNGYSKDTFAPDAEITREQFATILYRYADKKGIDVSYDAEKVNLTSYEDKDRISDYAVNAIFWANETGLIKGVTVTTLEPQGMATRAQTATIFMRFDALIEQAKADVSTENKNEKVEVEQTEPDKNDNSSSGNNGGSKKESTDEAEDKDGGKDDSNTGGDKNDDDKNAGEWDDVKDEKPGIDTPGDDSSKDDPDKNKPAEDEKDNEDVVYDTPTIVVERVSTKAGEEVSVNVDLHKNPGILGMLISIEYDESVMKLVDVKNGNIFSKSKGYTFMGPKNKASGCRASWYTLDEVSVETDGTFVTLCFETFDNASSGTYSVKVKYNKDDVFCGEESVDLDIENGKIIIK